MSNKIIANMVVCVTFPQSFDIRIERQLLPLFLEIVEVVKMEHHYNLGRERRDRGRKEER